MHALLDARPDLDAVFAASDLMAAGALRALRERGRSVPGDVAVVGFEDSDRARVRVGMLRSASYLRWARRRAVPCVVTPLTAGA